MTLPSLLDVLSEVRSGFSSASHFPPLKQFTYGNGIVHTLAQNARGLPDRSKDAYGGVSVLDDSYDYDFNGNVASISDGRAGASPSMSRTMTYDGLDRLTSVTSPMFNGTISYTYDVFDNIETLKAPANNLYSTPIPARDLRYCYKTATNQLQFLRSGATDCSSGQATTAFDFDDQGNIESKNAWGYRFTFDRLREVSVSNVVKETYRYDANGRRVTAEAPGLGKIRSYYNKGGQLSFQADGRTGKNLAYVYLSGSLVATREQPTAGGAALLKFHHTDALGSPVAVTNAIRSIIETSKYEPYGSVINRALRDGHGFTGHIEDAQTGLNYMQQRYYDPAIGRFLSVDPVTANSGTGANFNRYWYANNNPYIFTDPDGRQPRRGEMNLCGTPGLCGTTDNASIMAANGGGRGGGGGTGENASVGLSKPAQGRPATSGNHQTLPVDEIDHEKWTKAAEMEPGDKLVIDSKGGIIVQPRAIAGPLPTFQFGYRVTQRPLTANGKIEAYVASPAWGKPEFYSSGFTGFLDRGGMQFFAPGGAGGNRWLIDFSGQESTHDNVVYPSLIIYTPLP